MIYNNFISTMGRGFITLYNQVFFEDPYHQGLSCYYFNEFSSLVS